MKKLVLLMATFMPMAAFAQSFTSAVTVDLNSSAVPGPLGSNPALAELTGANGAKSTLYLDAFGNGGTGVSDFIVFRKAQGTDASPSAVGSGDVLGNLQFQGCDTTTPTFAIGGQIRVTADQTWSSTVGGAFMGFYTMSDTSASLSEQLRIFGSGGVAIGNVTISTDPGAGNLLVSGGTVLTTRS
jgi:hypothetical protein